MRESADFLVHLALGLFLFVYAPIALIPYWIAVYRNTVWRPFLFWCCLLLAWTISGCKPATRLTS